MVSRLQAVGAPDNGDRTLLEPVLRTGATMSVALTSVLLVPLLVAPAQLFEWTYGEPFRQATRPLVC